MPELDGLPLRPAAAAMSEVLAMGDQTLVQVAGEQQVAVGAGVVAEEVAGADLAAAAVAEHGLIEPGPVFDGPQRTSSCRHGLAPTDIHGRSLAQGQSGRHPGPKPAKRGNTGQASFRSQNGYSFRCQ